MIITNIRSLRDPFLLVDNGVYYVYGTEVSSGWLDSEWACYKCDTLDGKWEKTKKRIYEIPENAEKQFWAPEVHKYRGAYYMFASYYSSATNHRGCSILRADSPEGPFVEITNGHITPADWDSIDGTFWVDDDGQPWMIFVHEWTSTEDKVGRMAAARLSEDLTHFISEPKELFRAKDPTWGAGGTTDGCFIYKTEDGRLVMLWSNFCGKDYCVATARSENGKVDGKWIQDPELLFTKDMAEGYDGGHGMIFVGNDGQKYLSIHSPNLPTEEMRERVVFIPIKEDKGRLFCDLDA